MLRAFRRADRFQVEYEPTSRSMLPLRGAATKGNVEQLHAELSRGTNVDLIDEGGETALMLAAHYGHAEAVQLLLAYKANPNRKTNIGITALMLSAHAGNDEVVQLLVERGANIETEDNVGNTASSLARLNGFNKVVEALDQIGVGVHEGRATSGRAYHAPRRLRSPAMSHTRIVWSSDVESSRSESGWN